MFSRCSGYLFPPLWGLFGHGLGLARSSPTSLTLMCLLVDFDSAIYSSHKGVGGQEADGAGQEPVN